MEASAYSLVLAALSFEVERLTVDSGCSTPVVFVVTHTTVSLVGFRRVAAS